MSSRFPSPRHILSILVFLSVLAPSFRGFSETIGPAHKSGPTQQAHQYLCGEAAQIWPGTNCRDLGTQDEWSDFFNGKHHEIWDYIGAKTTYVPIETYGVVTYGGRDYLPPYDPIVDIAWPPPREGTVSYSCYEEAVFNGVDINNTTGDGSTGVCANQTVGELNNGGNDIIEGAHEEDLFTPLNPDGFGDIFYNGADDIDLFYPGVAIFYNHFRGVNESHNGGEEDGLFTAHYSAIEKAELYWNYYVIPNYPENKDLAYYYLGRVAHLLVDMCVPAHANGDEHVPIVDPDAYETYMGEQYDEYSHSEVPEINADGSPTGNRRPWGYNIGDWDYNDFDYVRTQIPGIKWDPNEPDDNLARERWEVQSDLFHLFWCTAELADNYDSDGLLGPGVVEGEVTQGSYYPHIEENECRLIGDEMMPQAMISVAELYKLFWDTVGTNVGDWPLVIDPAEQKNPAVASDSSGSMYLVWQDNRDGNWEIYFSTYGRNGDPIVVEKRVTDTPGSSTWPDISVDSSGNSYIVWDEARAVKFCILDPLGDKMVGDIHVSGSSISDPYPVIATTPDGTSHIAYERTVVTLYRLYYRKLDANGNFVCSEKEIYSNVTGDFPKKQDISLDESGNCYLTWRDRDSWWNKGIYVCRINPNCSEQAPYRKLTSDNAQNPRIYATETDRFYIVHEDKRGATSEIYSVIGNESDSQISDAGGNSYEPAIATPSSNHSFIAWEDDRLGAFDIYLSEAGSDGEKIASDIRISDGPANSRNPDICLVDDQYRIVWQDDRNGSWDIYGSFVPALRPVAPTDGAEVRCSDPPPVFHWTAGRNDVFQVQVSVDDFSSIRYSSRVLSSTTWTMPAYLWNLMPRADLYWRVRGAYSGDDPWVIETSEAWQFTKATVGISLTAPADAEHLPGPTTFRWASCCNTRWRMQASLDNFSTVFWKSLVLRSPEYDIAPLWDSIPANTDIYWRVIGANISEDTLFIDTSNVWTFRKVAQ